MVLSRAQERNLEAGRRLAEIYSREGPWAVERHFDEFFHPGFEWKPAVSALGDQVYVGREGYSAWQRDMEAIADEAFLTDLEVRALGDRIVLLLSRMRMVGKESGVPTESEYGAVFDMEDGRGIRGRAFLSHAEAERAAEDAEGVRTDAPPG